MKPAWQDEYWIRRRRSSERYDLISAAELSRDGHADLPVTLLNISRYGCRLATPQMLPIGDHVALTIAGAGTIEGRVVWHLGFKAGVEFDDHLAWKKVFGALLQAIPRSLQDQDEGVRAA